MTEHDASKNTLLTIILVLLILITGAMIFNFYGMRIQNDTTNIPKCVGAGDLNLKVNEKSNSNVNSDNSSRSDRVGKLLREKVGDYSDGSYNPELQAEMIKRAQEAIREKVRAAQASEAADTGKPKPKPKPKPDPKPDPKPASKQKIENMKVDVVKTDKSEDGKVKFCIYHMKGCGHCHDIMTVKQQNGLTKFQELQKVFANKPNVEILDFQHGRDPEASKFNAFPVIMLVKDGSSVEYNRDRSVEGMARFITQNL